MDRWSLTGRWAWVAVLGCCSVWALPAFSQTDAPDAATSIRDGLDWASPADALAVAGLGRQRGVAEVGVLRQGQARYGIARNRVEAAPAQALFEVGSISKVFTGLLLAQAVERGELSLDDTVGRLLQGQALPDLPPRVAAITLGQLVTHTSCLARLPGDFFRAGYDAANPYQRYDRVRLWASLAQARLVQAPPCQSSYSNWGFGVLGELLSVRYGRPWAELVRERITAPLGMYDTVQELGDKASRLAVPHEGEQVVSSWDFDALAGVGALRSTTADMLLFSRALLAGREGPLGPAAERMFTVLAEHEGAPIGYALMLRDQGGKQTWLHGGGTGGYRAVWLLALDSGEAVIALMSNARALQSDVMAPLLRMRHPAPEGRPAVPGDAIDQHVGTYRASPQLTFGFVVRDGQLHSRASGGRFEPLQVWGAPGEGRFTQPATGRQFRFVRDGAGPATVHYERFGVRLKAVQVQESLLALDAPVSDEALAPYGGRYRLAGGAVFDVQVQDGRLQVRLGTQPRFTVYPVLGQPDRFGYDSIRAELQFERYPSGEVRAVVLHQNGVQRALRLEP